MPYQEGSLYYTIITSNCQHGVTGEKYKLLHSIGYIGKKGEEERNQLSLKNTGKNQVNTGFGITLADSAQDRGEVTTDFQPTRMLLKDWMGEGLVTKEDKRWTWVCLKMLETKVSRVAAEQHSGTSSPPYLWVWRIGVGVGGCSVHRHPSYRMLLPWGRH